jgi:serine/threonine protein kinase
MSSTARARPDDTPQLIDLRYEVESTLGRGGMSVVYAVRDRNTGARCALKQIEASNEAQRALHATQLQHEYAMLGQLSHPSIIKVYDYGVVEARPYYTMELLEGSDLASLAPMPAQQVCKVLREIASALALLHSRRVLHRDTTTGNVRLDAQGNAKLIDFGAMVHMGTAEHVIGTPPYIPPEVLVFRADQAPRVPGALAARAARAVAEPPAPTVRLRARSTQRPRRAGALHARSRRRRAASERC